MSVTGLSTPTMQLFFICLLCRSRNRVEGALVGQGSAESRGGGYLWMSRRCHTNEQMTLLMLPVKTHIYTPSLTPLTAPSPIVVFPTRTINQAKLACL